MEKGKDRERKFKHLSWHDRLTIERMLKEGFGKPDIAKAIGCSVRTIYYEVKRATYEHKNSDWTVEIRYNPDGAQEAYEKHLKAKGQAPILKKSKELVKYISDLIVQQKFSPEACLMELHNQEGVSFDYDIKSVNTVYAGIRKGYFKGVTMEALPRRGKTYQKKEKVTVQKRASKGTSIEKRPKEIDERKTFGHWEMDCVVGKSINKKTILVLTERKTRFEIMEQLKEHTAIEVVRALNRIEKRYQSDFYKIFKTITVDNGSEFADDKGMEKALYRKGKRTVLYYCHARSPQERGSNEVQNHLVRRWYPKGSDFDVMLKKNEMKEVEWWINTYPRRLFKGRSSIELFEEELSALGCKVAV